MKQKEVWRVERAGPANGGALSTAGGLVFQGTGTGRVHRARRRERRSSSGRLETQTGVIAAPISYAVDGEQYVAVIGRHRRLVGGDVRAAANVKGNDLPNISRAARLQASWRGRVASSGGTAGSRARAAAGVSVARNG